MKMKFNKKLIINKKITLCDSCFNVISKSNVFLNNNNKWLCNKCDDIEVELQEHKQKIKRLARLVDIYMAENNSVRYF